MAHCFEDPNSKEKEADLLPTLSKAKRTTPTLVLERKLKHQISSQRRPYYVPWKPGKQVDDEDLRELMKDGIGRPSTRANIIETLFKRQHR
jgi:DNA topoisomerase-3